MPGQTGRGATVEYSTNLTTPAYAFLATLISVDGPGVTVGEVEDVLLASTFKPYLSTIPEGESSLTVRHNNGDAGIVAFRGFVAEAPVPTLAFRLTYQDGEVDLFQAFPKGYKVTGIENETRVTASIDLRIVTPIASSGGGSGSSGSS
jgi:hypothetical protein